jgi:hypothetical protein
LGFVFASDDGSATIEKLYLWIGESHKTPDGKELLLNLNRSTLHNNNIVLEITNSIRGQRPSDFIIKKNIQNQYWN